jgi:hypothetical protein
MSSKKSDKASQVRISITNVNSELSFECPLAPEEIRAAVSAALSSSSPLILTDVRGHEVIVPAEKIGYVEIGQPTERRVGFGAN